MPTCPNCGNQAAENAVFCDQCGARLPALAPEPLPGSGQPGVAVEPIAGGVPEGVLICPDCGAENVPGELFCDVCGNPLEAPAPVAASAVAEAVVEPVVEPVIAEVVAAETIVEEIVAAPVPAAAPAPAQDVYCPTCGAPVQPEEAFCGNCGAAVGAPLVDVDIVPIEPMLDESAEALPVEELVVEQAPVEEWVPQEILVEEVVVEQVVVEEAPAEVAPLPEVAAAPEIVPVVEPAPLPEPTALPDFEPVVPAATGPYLEIADSGAHIPLVAQAALLMGRVDEVSSIYPEIDLTPHGGEESGVSRRHAELQHVGGAWFVVDLDSTNGTFLNGAELQPKVRAPLSDGDRFALGELQIVFHA